MRMGRKLNANFYLNYNQTTHRTQTNEIIDNDIQITTKGVNMIL